MLLLEQPFDPETYAAELTRTLRCELALHTAASADRVRWISIDLLYQSGGTDVIVVGAFLPCLRAMFSQ